MIENNLAFNASDVEKYIKDEAKKRAVNNLAIISADEVKEMIIGYKADTKTKTVKEQGKEEECENQTTQQTSLF